MSKTYFAYAVHVLTASGAAFAMLALLQAFERDWAMMFVWLLVAFVIDGIDGPLARHFDTKNNAPIYDGVLLDLIVDYLTYVFIPTFALFHSGFLNETWAWITMFIILITAGLYFSDTRMKNADNSFYGFPGCWNIVVLAIFAVMPPQWLSLLVISFLAIAQFLPLKFVHPTRTLRWRPATVLMSCLWVFFAFGVVGHDFGPPSWINWGLSITTIYLFLVGILFQIMDGEFKSFFAK